MERRRTGRLRLAPPSAALADQADVAAQRWAHPTSPDVRMRLRMVVRASCLPFLLDGYPARLAAGRMRRDAVSTTVTRLADGARFVAEERTLLVVARVVVDPRAAVALTSAREKHPHALSSILLLPRVRCAASPGSAMAAGQQSGMPARTLKWCLHDGQRTPGPLEQWPTRVSSFSIARQPRLLCSILPSPSPRPCCPPVQEAEGDAGAAATVLGLAPPTSTLRAQTAWATNSRPVGVVALIHAFLIGINVLVAVRRLPRPLGRSALWI